MTSDKIRIALLPGATFSDLMEILQKHIHFLFLREVNIGPYLYYLLKVNIETRDLIYVYNQWFDEDLVSLRQEPKVTAVEVEVEYLMDDNMYDSEVQQLWNLNGSITPSQNIPITWKRKSFTGKDQTIAFVELEYMQTNHRDLVNQVGRKGKGSIYVMSAGNDGPRFNTNTFSLRNSIYAIVVSAVNARRELPSYASVGSSIMVVAYGGHLVYILPLNLLNPVSECSKMDSGTSIASPTVSGVIALVLEARPDLSWRDVQHLIVCTANTDLKGTLVEWERNGAGFLTHPRLGFGLIDAYNMVSLAEQWMLVPKQLSCSQTYRGQVELYLISPRGTKSYILTNRPADRLQPETFTWEFKSVQSWGENPCGTFLLSFGTRSNDVTG
ncbi:PCSK1 [Mytilus edulis]|uniref:PCSK1 n=1 Tax=Mytilus edulis TaxID=6550 RepID=A0A8S3SUB0_MYTED|nr:PCSK1 [Mytilus edulis]